MARSSARRAGSAMGRARHRLLTIPFVAAIALLAALLVAGSLPAHAATTSATIAFDGLTEGSQPSSLVTGGGGVDGRLPVGPSGVAFQQASACTLMQPTGGHLFDFGARLGDPAVTGLVEESQPIAASVPAGTYLVQMQSFDDSHPAQGTQPQEQWVARFFGAGGLDLESAPISDLPNDQQTLSEVVGEVMFGQDITSVVVRHLLYGGPYPTPESIEAVCLSLTPTTPPQGTIKVQKVVLDENFNVLPGANLAGFQFDVSPASVFDIVIASPDLTTDSGGMDSIVVEVGPYFVTELEPTPGNLVNLGGFSHPELTDPQDCFEYAPSKQEVESPNGSIGSGSQAVFVEVFDGQTAIVCWYNQGDTSPPPPPDPFTVTFTKAVTTSGAAQGPAAGTEFDFDLDCIGTDQTFALADDESHAVTFTGDTRCSLTETNSQGADSVVA